MSASGGGTAGGPVGGAASGRASGTAGDQASGTAVDHAKDTSPRASDKRTAPPAHETTLVLHGRKVVGGYAEGEAMVTRETISGWGGVNAMEGKIIETRHELRGQSFKDKVLVFRGAKGSSGWSVTFHLAKLAGTAPKAMIFNEMTTKVALGAVVMRVPAVTELDQDPLEVIETGDWVRVDGDKGTVEVIKRH